MKTTTGLLSKVTFLALAALTLSPRAQAQIDSIAPGYSISTYYTHSTSDEIVSYDWDASNNLYYMTTGTDFSGGVGFWETNGAAPTNLYSSSANSSGESVVTIGNYVYFNYSDLSDNQYIANYGPVSGTPALSVISTTSNYALFGHSGNLFITGSGGSSLNSIYYSALNANGTLVSNPATTIGSTPSGYSGPLAFDSAGNLYYAPGYGDAEIYKWSAAEVATAIANPGNSSDALGESGHVWLNYSSLFPSAAGGTSMLVGPDGNLLLTLTDFSGSSNLVDFGVSSTNGSSDGVDTTILTDSGADDEPLGELREHDGNTYISTENEIVQIVPEPGSLLLAGAGLAVVFLQRRRKS